MKLKTLAVLPARYGSTRFPAKPLALILGKPMIWWTAQQALAARSIDDVIVATDDIRIKEVAEQHGIKAVMTRSDHQSGTDRVAEVIAQKDVDVIVNLQGDEPAIPPEALDMLVSPFVHDSSVQMATLACSHAEPSLFINPDKVKVVTNLDGFALYFSRAPIPYPRDTEQPTQPYLIHVGIYAYRKNTLLKLTRLPQSQLESIEKLEQLRALENGIPVKVLISPFEGYGVDRPVDIPAVEQRLSTDSRYAALIARL